MVPWGRRRAQRGSQSLEWIGLGSFVVTLLSAATVYANSHLGGDLGQALVTHITSLVKQ